MPPHNVTSETELQKRCVAAEEREVWHAEKTRQAARARVRQAR